MIFYVSFSTHCKFNAIFKVIFPSLLCGAPIKNRAMEDKNPVCPWHRELSCDDCLATVCEDCKEGQAAQVDKRRYVYMGLPEKPSWAILQPVSLSSTASSATGHCCGCVASLKQDQEWTEDYFGRHFGPIQTRRRPATNEVWLRTYKVLQLHAPTGACFARVQPVLWVRRSTVASPWRVIPYGSPHSYTPTLAIPPDFSLSATAGGATPKPANGSCREPAVIDAVKHGALQPFQSFLVDAMVARSTQDAMVDLLAQGGRLQVFNSGHSKTSAFYLPHMLSSASSLVCTMSTDAQRKHALQWLADKTKLVPGGLLVMPAGYGKRVITSAYLGMAPPSQATKHLPALVVAESSSLGGWKRELAQWAPKAKVHILGPGDHLNANPVFAQSPLQSYFPHHTIVVASSSKMLRYKNLFQRRCWSTLAVEDCHTYARDSAAFALMKSLTIERFWGLSTDPGEHAWSLLCRASWTVLSRLGVSFQEVFTLDPKPYTYALPDVKPAHRLHGKTRKRKRANQEEGKPQAVPFLPPQTLDEKILPVTLEGEEAERYKRAVAMWSISPPATDSHHELKQKFLNLMFVLGPFPSLPLSPSKTDAFHRLHIPASATQASDDPCPICRDQVLDAAVQVTPCHHRYCFECLKGWWCGPRSACSTCPVCCVSVTGFMFEDGANMGMAPADRFPRGCVAKLRALEPIVRSIADQDPNPLHVRRLVIASISSVVLETVAGWIDAMAIPFSHIASRSPREAARACKAFSSPKSFILLAPYGKLGTERDLALNLNGLPVHHVVFMEPEAFVPPVWRKKLLDAVTAYHNPARPDAIETIDCVCKDTMETSPFIERCQGSGYSMRFLEAALTTIRVLETYGDDE